MGTSSTTATATRSPTSASSSPSSWPPAASPSIRTSSGSAPRGPLLRSGARRAPGALTMAPLARRGLRERLLYFALVPAIVVAVLVLGGVALRTTLQIEKARQQTVFDATL